MKVFLDSNVLIYQHDVDAPAKQRAAQTIVRSEHRFVISTQVLVEYHANLTRKLRYPRQDAADVIATVVFETLPTDRRLVNAAVETAALHQLSIFDALILEAAATAGCDELWTEDLNAGATLRGVRIVNPFADVPARPAAD